MFGFGEAKEARDELYEGQPHESKLSHELIAGAASFEAMKLYEDRQRKQGGTVKHAFAKEAIAGLVGAEVDKLFETKGLDEYDHLKREHAKKKAEEQAFALYDEHHGCNDEFDPERPKFSNY